jgi:hypothetical protein
MQYKWGERFGGEGFPDWAVEEYPATESGMREAVSNFWIDGALQNHFFKMWAEIARTYANEPTIAGYDILNEPWIYTSVIPYLDASYVDLLYMKTIKAIRTVDPNHIIFLEPANIVSETFPYKENIVWSPHFYPLAFSEQYSSKDMNKLETDLKSKYQKFIVEYGAPMWIGEFGAFMNDKASRDAWLVDAIKLFEKYKLGWAWWPSSDTDVRSIPSYLLVKGTASETTFKTATLDVSSYFGRHALHTFVMGLIIGLIVGSLTVYIVSSRKPKKTQEQIESQSWNSR